MSPQPRHSPLSAVLAFVFINSLGTGAVTLGIFFLAEERFGLGPMELFLLGVLIGAAYIPGAVGIGPMLRKLAGRYNWVSTRSALGATMAMLGLSCFIPPVAVGVWGEQGQWSIWVFVLIYAPLCGVLWPITEGYVSGGRRGHDLRVAVGRFNVVWSSAVVVAFWAMAPLVERGPLDILLFLGVVHLVGTVLLVPMGRDPGRHVDDSHEPHPAVYRKLLTVFRFQLPASYLVISALLPFLAFALDRMEIPADRVTLVASTWMVSRLATFLLFERWGGWHGRWWVFFVTGFLMLGGFAVCVIAPTLDQGLWLLLPGLVACGLGIGGIYAAALYYVMEVGDSSVDAGGTHETLIGLGFTVGPLCGVAAVWVAGRGDDGDQAGFEPTMLVLVCAVVVLLSATAFGLAWRHARGESVGTKP